MIVGITPVVDSWQRRSSAARDRCNWTVPFRGQTDWELCGALRHIYCLPVWWSAGVQLRPTCVTQPLCDEAANRQPVLRQRGGTAEGAAVRGSKQGDWRLFADTDDECVAMVGAGGLQKAGLKRRPVGPCVVRCCGGANLCRAKEGLAPLESKLRSCDGWKLTVNIDQGLWLEGYGWRAQE